MKNIEKQGDLPLSPRKQNITLKIAVVAMMAATIEVGKLVLASLPNVEVVTLLVAVYSYVFGIMGVLSSVVFVAIEPLVWGVNTWIITYFLYWPLVGFVFYLLGKRRVKNRFLVTGAALLLVLYFGVLSSLVDVGLFMERFDNFLARFGILYARGLVFYGLELVTNAVLFPLCFPFLTELLQKIKSKLF